MRSTTIKALLKALKILDYAVKQKMATLTLTLGRCIWCTHSQSISSPYKGLWVKGCKR